ncbi:hypothetical protein SEA_LIZZ_49 [Streptomyces phage Lizz]|nr:hypothetical protein SEA_PHTOWN_49 [Streptomyces phage PHTowN]QNO12866.1 hypothetical protein SEA_SHAKENBAKE_49 [Streptomyces phage ShakeNBake]QYW07596.1 hypothetical protein SEA_LIZZ_49 [Streptomyces phage Lizz]
MSDTMRRIRSYQRATRRRKSNQLFQGKMLVHLVQSRKAKTRKMQRELHS